MLQPTSNADKRWTLIGLFGFGIVVSLTYQNCGSGTGFRSAASVDENAAAGAPTSSCQAQLVSWQSGASACSANSPQLNNGMQTVVLDSTSPTTGNVSVKCDNGILNIDVDAAKVCQTSQTTNPVNGDCGPVDGTSVASMSNVTSAQLCAAGLASIVVGTGPWTWSCQGINSGTTESCNASKTGAAPVNGDCGSSDGQTLSEKPTTGLCNTGQATTVLGSGPWTWTCPGTNNGTTDNCTANRTSSGGGGAGSSGLCGGANGDSKFANQPPTEGEFCFRGTAINKTGSGPWRWICQGIDGGANSPECTTNLKTSENCTSSTIAAGTRTCIQLYGETMRNCSSTCVPRVCATGYQLNTNSSTCETLNTGSCTIGIGKFKLRAQSTLEAWSCEYLHSASETLVVGESRTYSCNQPYGFSADLPIKCMQSQVNDQPTNNNGQPYMYKRLHYYRGIYQDNDWFYAIFQPGGNPNTIIFEEYLGTYNTRMNFRCSSNPDISTTAFGGVRIQGPISDTTKGSKQGRCMQNEDGQWMLIKIECGNPDQYTPTTGIWDVTGGIPAVYNSGDNSCSGTGSNSTKTQKVNLWSPASF